MIEWSQLSQEVQFLFSNSNSISHFWGNLRQKPAEDKWGKEVCYKGIPGKIKDIIIEHLSEDKWINVRAK